MIQLEKGNGFLWNFVESIAKIISRRHNSNRSSSQSIVFKLAKNLCIDRKKQEIGLDRCRNLLTAAAPMHGELKNYFLSLDLTVRNLYGMTELSVHSVATKADPLASIGKALDGVEAKIVSPDFDDLRNDTLPSVLDRSSARACCLSLGTVCSI